MCDTKEKLNKKSSILILNLAKYFGGAAVRTLQIARMLHTSGYHFCVVVLDQSPLHLQLNSEMLPVKVIKYSRGDIRIVFSLKTIIQQGHYNVIDTHNPQSHLWGLLAAKLVKNCRVVTTVHGCYGESVEGWRSTLYDAVLQWNDNGKADFIAVSGGVVQYLDKIGIHKANIVLSENAVLPAIQSEKSKTVRELSGWENNTCIIAIAARLETVKGIKYLIKAFALAYEKQPRLRLCIIGDGRLREDLENLVQELALQEFIFFTGFRKDVPTLLLSVDIFCLASLSEGLPFAVLEASMAKCSLVLSDVGGLGEFFTDEETALLFPAKDIKQLANCFIKLIEQPKLRKKLAEQTYQWVSERFSAQKMFDQTVLLYNGDENGK